MSGQPSLRQLARLLGVNEKAVRKALAAGVFKGSVHRDETGAPVLTDLALAVSEWERSGRQLRAGRRRDSAPEERPAPVVAPLPVEDEPDDLPSLPVPDVHEPTLVDAQRAAMVERGRKLKLENDLREGQLVEASAASREAFEFARVIREAVLNIPARLAAELAGETDATRVHLRLEAALHEALQGVASRLEAGEVNQ